MRPGPGGALPVLVAAAGDGWEAHALELLGARGSGLAVHKRCVDLHDLVASGRTGLARVALCSATLPGLDADSVAALARSGVALVVVTDRAGAAEQLLRMGAHGVLGPDLGGLVDSLLAASREPARADQLDPTDTDLLTEPPGSPAGERPGRLAVWGPAGAPGRTTVSGGLAAELATRGRRAFLLDADPYGGAVAQHLGVLDEVSGLLAAARAANAGRLDAAALAGAARTVGSHDLRVLTGLPRPDRWVEVRPAAFEALLDAAILLADHVVVDTGFSLEGDVADPFATGPQRNAMTLTALERAHEVVVVGGADPVGLARLARGLVDLRGQLPDALLHVVVNRNRPTLGWSEGEVRGMVEGFVGAVPVTFLPEDRPTADRCLMSGRSLTELGDSPLRRAVSGLANALVGAPAAAQVAGRVAGQAPNSR